MRPRTAAAAILAAVFSISAAFAAVSVVLEGGSTMEGTDVRRLGDAYRVTMADGRTVSVPRELVVRIEVTADESSAPGARRSTRTNRVTSSSEPRVPRPADKPAAPSTDSRPGSAEPRFESPGDLPSGEGARRSPDETDSPDANVPRVPASPGIQPDIDPTWSPEVTPDDRDVLSKNSVEWRRPDIDPTWTPESAYGDEDVLEKNRVEWSRPGIDPGWTPESSFGNEDVLEKNRVEWKRPGIDPTWRPTDGFHSQPTSLATTVAREGASGDREPFESGVASWYGEPFQGKRTASGAPYDMHALTAAHPTLPFGTLVLVTSRASGLSIPVKITDRGPSIEGRVINLSYAAAEELKMVRAGIVDVRIDLLKE